MIKDQVFSAQRWHLSQMAIASLLAIGTIVLLGVTAPDLGLTWDEPVYMEASESYVSWLDQLVADPAAALSQPSIQAYWDINHEHPPVDKVWSGLIWRLTRGVLDNITAHRLGNMIVAGCLVGIVYAMVARDFGSIAGLAAAGALITMPRFFFHSHLAALDVPTTATIFLVCFVFYSTLDREDWAPSIGLGLAFGLAVGTKINALVELPIVLVLWALVFRRRKYIFLRLAVMMGLGTLLFVLFWPWLYQGTLNRLDAYLDFITIDHYAIAQWYRWRFYLGPPWHFPFVMTIAVTPTTLLALSVTGTVCALRSHAARSIGGLLLLGAGFPLFASALGFVRVFDDERLFMPAFPFIAGLAGIGFGQLARLLARAFLRLNLRRWSTAAVGLLGVVTFLPQVASAHELYPHLLSYYSEAIGGPRGALRLGLETTYWSETYLEALTVLNENAWPGAIVWAESHDVLLYYQREGKLRGDVKVASRHGSEGIVQGTTGYTLSIEDADFALIQYRQSGMSGDVLHWIGTHEQIYVRSYDGIPLVAIYKR